PAQASRPREQLCDLWGPRFRAQISTRGGGIKHFFLLDAKYREDGQPIDLSTTPDLELRRQLRFDFHNPAAKIPEPERQLGYDSVDFTLERATGKECVLVFRDDAV